MVTVEIKSNSQIYRHTKLVIASCPLFEFADPEVIMNDPEFMIASYSSGESIYNRTEYERAIGVVVKGKALIFKDHNDGSEKSVIMREMSDGNTFGVAALFGESDEYASVIKASGKETVVAYISQGMMKRLMERDFRTAQRYIEFLSDRIRYLNKKLDLYTSANAHEKLLAYLRGECDQGPVNMQKLSKQLDMGRATLYRAVDRLVDEGKIRKEGKSIVLIDSND